MLPRSSWQDVLNCPSKFQRHVLMSCRYDVFPLESLPALVTRKVTQKRSICAKSAKTGHIKSKSDVYRLALYDTERLRTDFRHAAQARRLRLAGHIWTQRSYLVVIRHYTLYNLLDLPEQTVYELRHNLGHLWRIVEPYRLFQPLPKLPHFTLHLVLRFIKVNCPNIRQTNQDKLDYRPLFQFPPFSRLPSHIS